jgi:RNA polymerase sigma factor (sigma-70 family)
MTKAEFYNEILSRPTLSKEEIRRLYELSIYGNKEATNMLFEHTLIIVIRVVETKFSDVGIPFDDLFQEGSIKLMQVIKQRRDINGDIKGYFFGCIKHGLLDYVRKCYRPIRDNRNDLSLDAPIFTSNFNDGIPFGDIIEDQTANTYSESLEHIRDEKLRNILKKLPESDRELLYRIYYEGEGYSSISEDQEVSVDTITRRKSKILQKLRHPNNMRFVANVLGE